MISPVFPPVFSHYFCSFFSHFMSFLSAISPKTNTTKRKNVRLRILRCIWPGLQDKNVQGHKQSPNVTRTVQSKTKTEQIKSLPFHWLLIFHIFAPLVEQSVLGAQQIWADFSAGTSCWVCWVFKVCRTRALPSTCETCKNRMESPNSLWYHVISVHSLWVCESPWVFTEVMHKSPCHPFATRAGRIQGNLVNRCEKCEEVRSKLCPISQVRGSSLPMQNQLQEQIWLNYG